MADDTSEKKATFRIDSEKQNPLSADTVRAICAFRDERNWRPFHNLKDLALSLNLEAAELLECFQWTGREEDRPEEREHMAEEPVGEWTADPEGRFTYVKYSPRTLALWGALKEVKLTTSETPDEVMALFSESTVGASATTLIERLARMVRLERMRDGIFLEAQTRGVLLRVFKALRAML